MGTDKMAWAEKYRPKDISSLIFPSETIKKAVDGWYRDGIVTENVLLYGKPGTGKSSLVKIIVKDFIKNEKDLFILGRKVDDIEKLGGWINSAPIASKAKIVVIEEVDRLSPAAFLGLKEKYMEKYQGKVSFIATTNNPYKVDPAVRTRFNLKINFDNLPADQVKSRLAHVLNTENIQYTDDQLNGFVEKHVKKGMRELLNLLQIASVNNAFAPEAVGQLAGVTDEAKIAQILEYMIKYISQTDSASLMVIYNNVADSRYYEVFGKYWKWVFDTLKQFADIDYDYIYNYLIRESDSMPLNVKRILSNYYNDNEFKIFKDLHLMSACSQIIEDYISIKK